MLFKFGVSKYLMNKKSKNKDDLLFYIGIFALLLLIYVISFISFGSILQRLLILFGAFLLFVVATFGKQKVLQALELVVAIGSIVSFLSLTALYALALMLFVAIIMVIYLYSISHYRKEPIGLMGSFGFVLLALGLAVNNGANTLIASSALGFGALTIAIYSGGAFLLYKNRIQLIFVVLNIAFAINPFILLFHALGI